MKKYNRHKSSRRMSQNLCANIADTFKDTLKHQISTDKHDYNELRKAIKFATDITLLGLNSREKSQITSIEQVKRILSAPFYLNKDSIASLNTILLIYSIEIDEIITPYFKTAVKNHLCDHVYFKALLKITTDYIKVMHINKIQRALLYALDRRVGARSNRFILDARTLKNILNKTIAKPNKQPEQLQKLLEKLHVAILKKARIDLEPTISALYQPPTAHKTNHITIDTTPEQNTHSKPPQPGWSPISYDDSRLFTNLTLRTSPIYCDTPSSYSTSTATTATIYQLQNRIQPSFIYLKENSFFGPSNTSTVSPITKPIKQPFQIDDRFTLSKLQNS